MLFAGTVLEDCADNYVKGHSNGQSLAIDTMRHLIPHNLI